MLTVEFRDDGVVEWHLTDDGAEPRRVRGYAPTVYVDGDGADLHELRDRVSLDPKVARTAFVERYPDLHAHHRDEPARVLRVDLERLDDVRAFAGEVRHHHEPAAFRPATFRLYDVDLSPGFRYCVETGTAPTGETTSAGEPLPRALRPLSLSLGPKALADGDVAALRLDGEPVAGDDAAVLRAVRARLASDDPDVLVLSSADLVPLLSDRAAEVGLADEPGGEGFALGRRPGYERLAGESTFHSYGSVGHSPARYAVPGRAIVDTSNSFMWAKSGLPGLAYLTERSWKPLQETARGSIGNILTGVQLRKAHEREVLAPWNKWEPESFKTVETLHAADRGGTTFDPQVGLHRDVVEIDFASLYPNIMCVHNISPETVDCGCRADGAAAAAGGAVGDVVPELGYAVCDRGTERRAELRERGMDDEWLAGTGWRTGDRGFVPTVLRRLVVDRAKFKSGRRETDDPDEAAALDAKADALKWILVSCFGYQGYRNAKFGRIECHEAINAHAREILVDAANRLEAGGWDVVHGIVDSLWVTPRAGEQREPIADVCDEISADVGVQLEHEHDFDWLAFVPKRGADEAGALNRYFGKIAADDAGRGGVGKPDRGGDLGPRGEYKVRGIEARQRSTPPFVATVQAELVAALDEAVRDGLDDASADGSGADGPDAVDRVCDVLARRLAELRRGAVDPSRLVVRRRVSKPAGDYTRETAAVAALRRSAELGVPRAPGQDVRFVVVDDGADGAARVRLAFEDPATYDADHYADALVRAAESVVSPLGVDREGIGRRLADTRDATLSSF